MTETKTNFDENMKAIQQKMDETVKKLNQEDDAYKNADATIQAAIDAARDKAGDLEDQYETLGKNVKSGMQYYDATDSWEWGADLVSGMASGMSDNSYLVSNAASSIMADAKSYLHFSRPDVGPMVDYETYMPDMVEGLARTLRDSSPVLVDQVKAMSQEISSALQPETNPAMMAQISKLKDNMISADWAMHKFRTSQDNRRINNTTHTTNNSSINVYNTYTSPKALSPAELERVKRKERQELIKRLRQ